MPTTTELRDTWRTLSSTGTPPDAELSAKVIPEWSVGINKWMDRLVKSYLRDYSLRQSHFKLVIAPYGGGKTHFLLAFRARSLEEGFATSYLQCKSGVSLADWSALYSRIAGSIRLPGSSKNGMEGVVETTFQEIQARAERVPDPDAAIEKILDGLEWRDGYASSSFLQVMSHALRQRHLKTDLQLYRSALTWLQDGQEKMERSELQALGLSKLAKAQLPVHGMEMFYSLVKFLTEFANVKGITLLLDETDTMFNARGKALEKLMAAMRTTIDQSDDNFNSIPVFGLFAAVPDINEQMQQYQALYQRFIVTVPFHSGNDDCPQIDLGHLDNQRDLLLAIGEKLLALGRSALEFDFDNTRQLENIDLLVQVAEDRVADVDSRRLFVKTWCALLDEQRREGEKSYSREELNEALGGIYEGIRAANESEEDDMG